MCRAPKPREQTFAREYVERLRAEAKAWRCKALEERRLRELAERERDDALAATGRNGNDTTFAALAQQLRQKELRE